MYELKSVLGYLFILLFISGCQSTAFVPKLPEQQEQFQLSIADAIELDTTPQLLSDNPVLTPEQIIQLNRQQQEAFLLYFNASEQQHLPPYKRLSNFIETLYPSFDYLGQTYTAEETLLGQHGNCMSLALLTSALAHIANVNVQHQSVSSRPIYRRYDNVMTISSHVRSILLDSRQADNGKITLLPARATIDYYRSTSDVLGSKITEQQFFSMYYRNLAGSAIIDDHLARAYALMHQALRIAPDDSENINTMAVILNKMGFNKQALTVYQLGADKPVPSLRLLTNYASLLKVQGQNEKASEVLARLGDAFDDNPYTWIDTARDLVNSGNRRGAEKLLQRAIQAAPYLHEAYFALSTLYYSERRYRDATNALVKAHKLANRPETSRLYAAKRSTLEREMDNTID